MGPLSDELEESCREEGGWSTWLFHNGAEGDLMGLSINGTLVCLRSGRLFFENRLGRPETRLDPAYDALRTCARVSEENFVVSSSSADKSRKSS